MPAIDRGTEKVSIYSFSKAEVLCDLLTDFLSPLIISQSALKCF